MSNTIPLSSKDFFENYDSNLRDYLLQNIEHNEKSYIANQKNLIKALFDAIEWQVKKVIDADYRIKALSNHLFIEYSLYHYNRPYDEDKDRDEVAYNLILIYEKIDFFLKHKLQEHTTKKVGIDQPEAIDLSDTKAIDKILYLQKLGVIDFLKGQQPFNTSVNSLASVLSAITGEKSGSLQPMLNPILSKKVDDKNNPLNSKNAVARVEKQLINIGFNLNETN
jgi:hypothetical protein